MFLLQLIINGVVLGAVYALVALGFVLIVRATSAVNFAQGDMVVAGGFTAIALAPLMPTAVLGVPGLVLLPLVIALMALFGLLFSLVAYFPLKSRPPTAIFVSTIALGVILQNSVGGIFGLVPRAAPPLIDGASFTLGTPIIGRQSVAIIVVAAILIVGLHLISTRTQIGRRWRAAAEDPEMARAVGIRVDRMIALTFALSTALAGAAGLLLANHQLVGPTLGFDLMIKAYIAVVIGGWGSIAGAAAGAFLVASFEIIVTAGISGAVADAGLYVALLVVLALRPRGLFGEPAGRRA